jgi:hypothetical protein
MSQIPIRVPEFTDAEAQQLHAAFDTIKTLLAPKFINLKPEDRKQYGRIKEKRKMIINKVKDYHENMPSLSNANVNWVEFDKCHTTRKNYMFVMSRLKELEELCNDPRTLVDYVLYGYAMQDYKWTAYKATDSGGGTGGYESKFNELNELLARGKYKKKTDKPK